MAASRTVQLRQITGELFLSAERVNLIGIPNVIPKGFMLAPVDIVLAMFGEDSRFTATIQNEVTVYAAKSIGSEDVVALSISLSKGHFILVPDPQNSAANRIVLMRGIDQDAMQRYVQLLEEGKIRRALNFAARNLPAAEQLKGAQRAAEHLQSNSTVSNAVNGTKSTALQRVETLIAELERKA